MQNPTEQMLAAYAQAWRLLAQASGCEAPEQEGLLTYFSMAEDPAFNPTVVISEPDDPVGALDRRASEYAARSIGFGFETPQGLAPRLEQAALDRGMRWKQNIPAMMLQPIPDLPDDSRFDIRIVEDETSLDEHVRVQAQGFESPIENVRVFTPSSLLRVSKFFLAYIDGEPAATSIVGITGNAAGIFGVSTRPEFRNKGIGRAVTRAAIAHAAEAGCDFAYLHATSMGLPVYERLGFKTLTYYKLYLSF
ncbi:MAG: GNAT family N-acetyltransferase [Actinomycetota bacterium]